MPAITKLGIISGLFTLVNSDPQLRQNINDLMFVDWGDARKNIQWSKTKIFVPAYPTDVPYIVKTFQTMTELLPAASDPNKPGIAYLGGNNGKYNKQSLETKLATLLCNVNGYDITQFKDGIESEIIHNAVAKTVPDSRFKSVELEKKSSNSKENWENALKDGLLDGVDEIIMVTSEEGFVRHKGTLLATLKAHGIDSKNLKIYAWPYNAEISPDNLKKMQQILGITLKVPNQDYNITNDKYTWNKSAWGIYRTFIEMLALRRWSAKGDVYVTEEQKKQLNDIFSKITVKNLAMATIKAKTAEMKEKLVKFLGRGK